MRRLLLAISLLAASAGAAPAQTVFANGYNCPRGLKFAAGACVAQCPGGYADEGARCQYRSLGSGGGGK